MREVRASFRQEGRPYLYPGICGTFLLSKSGKGVSGEDFHVVVIEHQERLSYGGGSA